MTPELLRNALSNMALNIEKAGPRNAMDTTAETLREAADYIAKAAAARLQAFEEAAKIAERHLPAGMYPEALAGAIAAAIRQHAKGDGKP